MALRSGLGLGLTMNPAVAGGAWTPADLGAKLLGWWNADRKDLITESGGLVTSWKDIVAGYDVQAADSARPTYSPTSFNGAPGIGFDGVANFLQANMSPFPQGATPCDIWGLVQQDAPGNDGAVRRIFAYGTTNNNEARFIARLMNGGANRGSINTGLGASATAKNDTLEDFSDRDIIRGIYSATTIDIAMNGIITGAPTAAVSATGTGSMCVGRGTNGAGFWWGLIREIIVTAALTTEEAATLQAYLTPRRMPAAPTPNAGQPMGLLLALTKAA